jgi:hypothetical protein
VGPRCSSTLLGDLDLQAVGGESGLAQRPRHVAGEIGIDELLARHVDTHAQRRARAPRGGVRAGARQHPLADRAHHPGLLGHGHEHGRRDQAAARVAPAQQRLGADQLAGLGVHLRLVVQHEALALDRLAQAVLEVEPLGDDLVHALGVVGVAAAALRLGVVHGGVGVADQDVGVGPVAREQGDADAHAHPVLALADPAGLGERVDDLRGDPRRVVLPLDVGQRDQELVAAEPRQQVALAQRAEQALADVPQQLVAHGVAQRVVDALEAVEVEEQHGQALLVARRVAEHAPQVLEEGVAVGEPGQRVVHREVVLALPRRGQVGEDAVALDRVAHRARHERALGDALHQVVLGAEAQRAHGQLLVGLRRERDDRHRGGGDARARERFEPLPLLEREVEQRRVERLVAKPAQAVFHAARLRDLEAPALVRRRQQLAHRQRVGGVVLDEEDAHGRRLGRLDRAGHEGLRWVGRPAIDRPEDRPYPFIRATPCVLRGLRSGRAACARLHPLQSR